MQQMLLPRVQSVAVAAGLVVCVAGCGRTPDKWEQSRLHTVPVIGRVTLDGTGVSEATVIFWNEDVPTSPSALTGQDGAFHLRTYVPKDGAPAGRYRVSIEKTTETQPLSTDPEAPLPPVEVTHHLPKRYRDTKTSGLTAEVTEQGPNEFVFELSTK